MAGLTGPPPKRSNQVRRRNKPPVEVTRSRGASRVDIPKMDDRWHPIAKLYYQAIRDSGQAAYFEPSDWAHVIDVLDDISAYKMAPKRQATMRMALDSALARLLVAEGDRRRLRIELERGDQVDEDQDASVTALNDYVSRFTG